MAQTPSPVQKAATQGEPESPKSPSVRSWLSWRSPSKEEPAGPIKPLSLRATEGEASTEQVKMAGGSQEASGEKKPTSAANVQGASEGTSPTKPGIVVGTKKATKALLAKATTAIMQEAETSTSVKHIPEVWGVPVVETKNPTNCEPDATTEVTAIVASPRPVLKLKIDDVLAVAQQIQTRFATMVADPKFQVVSMSGGGSAVVLSAVGGGCGMLAGYAAGAAVGVVPSLFTFGLSIPVCGVAGGVIGTGAGAVAGASAGFIGGGIVGGVAYSYRLEIKDNLIYTRAKVVDITSDTKARALDLSEKTHSKAKAAHSAFLAYADDKTKLIRAQALELKASSQRVAADPHFQVSAASAAGGAVVLGVGGGVAGMTAGAVTGAAVGLVPALFTFGLSIPVGAVIGGSAGLCLGATTGASSGLVGGGAVGYGSYSKRKEIGNAVHNVKAQAKDSASYVQNRARDSASFVKTKILGGSTGGTA